MYLPVIDTVLLEIMKNKALKNEPFCTINQISCRLFNSSSQSGVTISRGASITRLQTVVFSYWKSSYLYSTDKEFHNTGEHNKYRINHTGRARKLHMRGH